MGIAAGDPVPTRSQNNFVEMGKHSSKVALASAYLQNYFVRQGKRVVFLLLDTFAREMNGQRRCTGF